MGKLDIFTALLISLPEGILLTAFTVQLLNAKRRVLKILVIGVLYALTSLIIRSFEVPYGIHTVILIISISLYSAYILKLKFRFTILTYLFTSILFGIIELVTVPVIEILAGISLNSAIASIPLKILFDFPIQLVTFIIYLILNKFRIGFLSEDTAHLIKQDSRISKTLIYTTSLLLFQNFIIILLYLSYKTSNYRNIFLYNFINIFPLVIAIILPICFSVILDPLK